MRRSAADRKAEAARYKEISDSHTPVVELTLCEYRKERKYLTLPSEYMGMPAKFYAFSNHTGKKVLFTAVQPGDPLWDEDGWDGEQCVYRPTEHLPKVDYFVIYNQF